MLKLSILLEDCRLDSENCWFPDGNGWSKLNGNYTAKGKWLYWEDGDITPNTQAGSVFTGFHGDGWGGTVDYSAGKAPPS